MYVFWEKVWVHEGSPAVWHLADMLDWLKVNVAYQLEPATLDVAKTTKQINLAKQARQIAPQINSEIQAFVV